MPAAAVRSTSPGAPRPSCGLAPTSTTSPRPPSTSMTREVRCTTPVPFSVSSVVWTSASTPPIVVRNGGSSSSKTVASVPSVLSVS